MDPRTTFPRSVELATATVIDFPALLFFCGGRINDASSPDPASVRDAVYRAFTLRYTALSNRIFLAEDFKDWTRDGVYNELFSFEQDLASLSSTIVIFLESAGSIAELGAFSQQDGVKQKLLIFLQTDHYEQDSFIKLGPLQYLENHSGEAIQPYPWQTIIGPRGSTVDLNSLRGSIDEICETISIALQSARVQRTFDVGGARDQMLLIRDIIAQLIALTIHEIESYLRDLGIPLEFSRIRQYLFVLKTLGLVRAIARGKHRYYVATDTRRFVRLGIKKGEVRLDPLRLQNEVAAYYRQHDLPRYQVVAPILATQEGD